MSGQENLAIPHDRVIAALELRLHAAVSELAMKDAAIEHLRAELETARAAAREAVRVQAPAEVAPSPS